MFNYATNNHSINTKRENQRMKNKNEILEFKGFDHECNYL